MRLGKSCSGSNSKKYEEKKKALELAYQHLWVREDGSKIADPWDIVDDHKDHTCEKMQERKISQRICDIWLKIQPKVV